MVLEDIFAGRMELTARERSFILHVLTEWYMGGGDLPIGVQNRRTFIHDICGKVTALKLEQMVTPDGSKLVSVAMHDSIVAEMDGECCRQLGPGGGNARCSLRADHVIAGEHHFSVGAMAEWPCYSDDPTEMVRCSGKRSTLAHEHVGDGPAPGGQLA